MQARMPAPGKLTLLRIIIGDDRIFGTHALHQELVVAAHRMGLAGATVMRGVIGYGPASRDIEPLLPLAGRPVIIEIIDSAEKISEFFAAVGDTIRDALVTVQTVDVLSPSVIDGRAE